MFVTNQRNTIHIISSFALLICSIPSLTNAQELSVEEAFQLSSQSGAPLFIRAGNLETCGFCRALENDLSNPGLNGLKNNFVMLRVSTADSAQYRALVDRVRPKGNGIPQVMIVRADGEELYNKSGQPKDLSNLMVEQLKLAGSPINTKLANQAEEKLKQAKELKESGDLDKAMKSLKKYIAIPTYAKPIVDVRTEVEGWQTSTQTEIEAAFEQLNDPEKQLESAIQIVQLSDNYRSFSNPDEQLLDKIKVATKDHDELFEQAKKIVKAQSYVKRDRESSAISAFQKIISEYPESPAAKFANQELVKLNAEPAIQSSDSKTEVKEMEATATEETNQTERIAKSEETTEQESTSAEEKKAKSFLSMGKVLSSQNPKLAVDYFKKVIEAAPESKYAKEAKKLMEELQ